MNETPEHAEKRKKIEDAVVTGIYELEVSRWDGSKETVNIRVCRRSKDVAKLIEAINTKDDDAVIIWATGKDSDWIGTITIDSQMNILADCMDVNFPHVERYLATVVKLAERAPKNKPASADSAPNLETSSVSELRKWRETQAQQKSNSSSTSMSEQKPPTALS